MKFAHILQRPGLANGFSGPRAAFVLAFPFTLPMVCQGSSPGLGVLELPWTHGPAQLSCFGMSEASYCVGLVTGTENTNENEFET